MEYDNGEMIVVRHEYDEEWGGEGSRQSQAYFAVREPVSYDGESPWWNSGYRIPETIHINSLHDIAGYRLLLDAIEERLTNK